MSGHRFLCPDALHIHESRVSLLVLGHHQVPPNQFPSPVRPSLCHLLCSCILLSVSRCSSRCFLIPPDWIGFHLCLGMHSSNAAADRIDCASDFKRYPKSRTIYALTICTSIRSGKPKWMPGAQGSRHPPLTCFEFDDSQARHKEIGRLQHASAI